MPSVQKEAQFESGDSRGQIDVLDLLDDERHIANALYLIQKAIALREQEGFGWPTIHACLRDAAAECEAARQHYTKEAMQRQSELRTKIFGDTNER